MAEALEEELEELGVVVVVVVLEVNIVEVN